MLGLLDAFVGGAFSKASIFALGIMPYISASIFMQLMTILVPQMAKGAERRRKRQKEDQPMDTLPYSNGYRVPGSSLYRLPENRRKRSSTYSCISEFLLPSTVIILTVGTLFVMWLGEKITDKGLGNGTSIIIMVGILARFPQAIRAGMSIHV